MPNTDNLITSTRPIEDSPQEVIEDPFNELKEMLLLVSSLKSEAKTKVNLIFINVLHTYKFKQSVYWTTLETSVENCLACFFLCLQALVQPSNTDPV